jgi:tRNA (cytosine34-C5)-methyltransferase
MSCVWSGVKIWEQSERDDFYMLTQDGMHIIEPFMNTKRKIELSRSELKKVLEALGREVPVDLFAPNSRAAIRALSPGSLVVSLKGGNRTLNLPIVINYTANDALKLIWRFRKGLEQAPKVQIRSLLTALDALVQT